MTDAVTGGRIGWRLGVVALAVVAVGLPVNSLASYALLLFAVVVAFSGVVTARPWRWIAALALVAAVLVVKVAMPPPRIAEGHNVFLPSPVLEQGLPGDVYRALLADFDARYPPARRCDPKASGCWQATGLPDRVFAFSADGVFNRPELSRSSTSVNFADPVQLRLGFINDLRYNWSGATDIERAVRDRRVWMGFQRWRVTMPWFEMVVVPASYVGGHVCWHGDVMWETPNGRFDRATHATESCRDISRDDVGRRIFASAVKSDTLVFRIQPPGIVRVVRLLPTVAAFLAALGVLFLLVRVRMRRLAIPLMMIGLCAVVIAVDDATILGGARPFEGGDDGLFYDSVGRSILQYALAGDWWNALRGEESVFYYGGPGLRYFRALEHLIFGETQFGYLALLLVLPFAVWAVFRRFLGGHWALALSLTFVALPVGVLFGTSFVNYSQWAIRGFADPAAYIFFICGIVPLVGASRAGPSNSFAPAFGGGLLMALAIFMKPIVAPACAVLLAGAGFAALAQRQWPRLAGLCLGFAPVFLITLHNWVYGGVFVLFSANSSHPLVLTMPPSAYLGALRDVAAFNFAGEDAMRALRQIAGWLHGPSESAWLIPVSLAGFVIVLRVVFHAGYDRWLRLLAGAALAQHAVALFYVATARYHFLTWFLTLVVTAAWLEQDGCRMMQQRWPTLWRRLVQNPALLRVASLVDGLNRRHAGG